MEVFVSKFLTGARDRDGGRKARKCENPQANANTEVSDQDVQDVRMWEHTWKGEAAKKVFFRWKLLLYDT